MAGKEHSLKTIWGIAKSSELRLSSEELHMLVETHLGKERISKLTKKEIGYMVSILSQMKDSVKRTEGREPKCKAGNATTAGQRRKIFVLQEELGWNDVRVNGMCKRLFKIDKVEWLNYQQCSKLIEALKGMLARQAKEA